MARRGNPFPHSQSNPNLLLGSFFIYLILYTNFPEIGSSTQKIQTFSVVISQRMRYNVS